jgi:cbb3-type cytochrome oxidase subunit 3
VGIIGIQFMMKIALALGVLNLIFIVVAIIFIVTMNGRIRNQQECIVFLFRRGKEEQRRQEQREDQLLQPPRQKQPRRRVGG